MLGFKFLKAEKLVELELHGELAAADFRKLTDFMTQEVTHHRTPCGVVIISPEFPGWKDLDAMAAHVDFIREHHRFMRRIAIVSDDITLRLLAEKTIAPLLSSELQLFGSENLFAAREWATAVCTCKAKG